MRQKLVTDGLWKDTCPVVLDRLVMLRLSYYDFDGKSHDDGEMIVMDAAAPYVLKIFKRLYNRKFPLKSVKLTSEYGGNDDLSMADNNTSAFNCRKVTGGSSISVHAYGLAIDVNPLINPYVRSQEVLPPAGANYLNRFSNSPGMTEPIVSIFEKNGFPVWGGRWSDRIDWQHFQPSREMAEMLATMKPKDAKKLFKKYARQRLTGK